MAKFLVENEGTTAVKISAISSIDLTMNGDHTVVILWSGKSEPMNLVVPGHRSMSEVILMLSQAEFMNGDEVEWADLLD